MVQPGVTIIRGPREDGYPFLSDTPEAITIISVAVNKKISKHTNVTTGNSLYSDIKDKQEMRRRIRLVLHAVMECGCTAVVLSALGCGLEGHPPEEVALMFKREIYRVGEKMPYIYFAIISKDALPSPTRNFEIFSRILACPENDDAGWISAKEVYFQSVIEDSERDFPVRETLGDAGGSGTKWCPKPTRKDKTLPQTQADDVHMGVSSSGSGSGAKKADEGCASGQATYFSAEAGSGFAEPYGDSPVLPATSSSVLSQAESSTGLVNLIIFPRKPSAVLTLLHERPEVVKVFHIKGAVCIDPAARYLLGFYVIKMNETVKWRTGWDNLGQEDLQKRAAKGQVRNGPGACEPWIIGQEASPPYLPADKGNQAIDMQVSELLDYAVDICNIPISYWRNDSESGQAAKQADNIHEIGGDLDLRKTVLLKVVRMMYDKPKCSFIVPLNLYLEEDVYYFPDGAAFTKSDKPTAFMAAAVLAVNPGSKMWEYTRNKGKNYVPQGRVLGDAPAASGSSKGGPAVKKKPAAEKKK